MNNQNKNAYFNWFDKVNHPQPEDTAPVSYTHLRAHET